MPHLSLAIGRRTTYRLFGRLECLFHAVSSSNFNCIATVEDGPTVDTIKLQREALHPSCIFMHKLCTYQDVNCAQIEWWVFTPIQTRGAENKKSNCIANPSAV